jgi:hypothetical protein
MSVARAQPNNFKYTQPPRPPEVGPLVFAGAWLLIISLLNIFYAISVIAGSKIFITEAAWLVGDARPWGGLMLVVGLIQLGAVMAVFRGMRFGLWVAVLSVCANIAAQVMFLSDFAAVAIVLLGVDAIILGCLIAMLREPNPQP